MWINEIKLLVIISWLPLLLLAIFARYYSRSWFSPMASWSGYWTLITFIAIVIPIDYKYSPRAILIIGLFVLAFVVGGMPFKYESLYKYKKKTTKNVINPLFLRRAVYARIFIFIALICALIVCLIYIHSVGISLSTTFIQMSLLTAPYEISYMRYYDYNPYSFWINLFSIPVYSSALLSGFMFSMTDRFIYKVGYLGTPIVAAGLITIVSTAKMGFLMSVFFFLGAFITSMIIFRNDTKSRISKKEMYLMLFMIFMTIVVFYLSFFLRYKSNMSNFHIITDRFMDSFSSFLAGFSAWIEQYFYGDQEHIDYWGFTFQWIRNFIDTGERPQGLFNPIYDYNGYGSPSNIFTIFRCMIEDFTMPGALMLLCLVSFLISKAYWKLMTGSVKIIYWGSMVFYYPLLFFSFASVIFGYSTGVASWLLACFLIRMLIFRVNEIPQEIALDRFDE